MTNRQSFRGRHPRIHASAFIASSALVIGDVEVGRESSIWFGAVLRGDHEGQGIRIGDRTNVQDNVVIHVSADGPTVLESDVTIGHGAVLESCRIGTGSVIGMNAVVLQGAHVQGGCLIAAGAVVKSGAIVPPNSLVAGVPGRVRPLTPAAEQWVRGSAQHYVDLSREYLAEETGSEPAGHG